MPIRLRTLCCAMVAMMTFVAGCQDGNVSDSRPAKPEPMAAAPLPAVVTPAWTQVVADQPSARLCSITVGDPQQVFHGFGTSFLHCDRWTTTTPLEVHRQLAAATWGEGGLRTMRTWLYLPVTMAADGTVDISDYVTRYIDSRLIAEARAAGCTRLVLAPAQFPRRLRLDPPETVLPMVNGRQERRVVSDASLTAMMEAIAEAISQLRDRHGITIAATGLQNEPNQDSGDSGYITIGQTPLAVKALRHALDQRGLPAVAIIAPETSSVDWAFDERINALRADPEAWAALAGVAWHSYNMAMVPASAAALRQAGKELWMTEASANGAEPSNDRVAAASMIARIANDLRYGASHWIWFLGYEGNDPKDDQTRLIRIFQHQQPVAWEKLGKFHPLKDLCAAFPPGSRVLETSSPAIGAWTYGRKPALQAVAARRPDGSFAVVAVNFTAPTFPAPGATGAFEIENAGLPSEVLRLDVQLPLNSGAAAVRRRDADLATVVEELLPVRDGHLTLVLRPLEIVTAVITP